MKKEERFLRVNGYLASMGWITLNNGELHTMFHLESTQGIKHRRAKLTEEGVYDIRKRYDEGESLSSIAKDYNIVESHVVKVGRRRGWKHLPERR